jgi:two-component system chemotaxis response regulator CheY
LEVVALADNGAAALRLAINTKPHIITMDLTMPEMDGVDCIKALIERD